MLTTGFIDGIIRAVEPLDLMLLNKESFRSFLLQNGLDIDISDSDFQKIRQKLVSNNDFSNIYALFNEQEENNLGIEELAGLLATVKNIITKTLIITQGTPDETLASPLNQDAVWQKIGRQTIDRLTFEALEADLPILAMLLLVTGIAEINYIEEPGPNKVPYRQYKINWEKLGDFITDPLTQIKDTYKWGNNTVGFDFERFYENLQEGFNLLHFFPRLETPENIFLDKYYSAGNAFRNRIKTLKVPLHIEFSQDFSSFAEIGVQLMPVPNQGDTHGKPMGFTLGPLFKGGFSDSIAQSEQSGISLQVSAGLETDAFFRLVIRPSDINFESDLSNTQVNAEIALIGNPDSPYILIGTANSHRVELEGFFASIGFKGNISDPEFIFKAGTGQGPSAPKLRFVFQAGESDGFLKSILGDKPHFIDLSGTIYWSSKHGIGFEGTAGFSILLPLHLSLGPISIDAIAIDASIGTGNTPKIGMGINVSGDLGPLHFACEQIGAQLKLTPMQGTDSGILGNLNAEWGFQPPRGLGLSINAGAVMGGGYLFFDFEKEEYAGALELTIANFISAKAIGLITTKMPDGSKGFSLLIIITAEFNPPFQLGYGFTLIGVGGLLGLNRTVLLEPLRNGVRTGAVNNIMFPTNVVANAPRIISDLKTIFPPYEGKFLIGPMGKIGWGTPTLVSLSFGLIIEIPGNIAILGVLKVVLPDEAAPIVKIQIAFVGTLDFDKKLLTFDASLYESSVLTMTLEGDMAVRLAWGDQPNFIMTVGGFHPSYTPPPLALPTLKRLAINILNTSIAKIRVECYQAITSNTVQFGARAEIFFDLRVCSISGHIAFDALFQFNPFYFIISLSAGFKLKAAGINLLSVRVKMSLEGPTPWRAKGTGSVSLLFFTISANFDKTWGDKKNTSLPEISILPQFLEQLRKKEQWSTVLSAGKNLLVSLRKLDEATGNILILHPAGSLVVQQKLLPLQVNIDKVGHQKTTDVRQLRIESASSNGTPLSIKDVNENFARAQYQNLSDAEKLSKPSFEKMPGGVQISMGDATLKNGRMVRKKVEYELTIIDKEPVKPFVIGKFIREIGWLFSTFIKGNSVSKSALSQNYQEQRLPFAEKLDIHEELFTVAFQSNNKAFNTQATFPNEMMAQTYMQNLVHQQPGLEKQIHIVPHYELQEV